MITARNFIHSLLHTHAFGFGIFVTLFTFVFFAGGLVVANGQTLGPNDSHVVNLYVDGEETSIPTRAATVKDFIDKAQVDLREGDTTEPSLTTPIDADNFRVHIYRAHPVLIIDGTTSQRVLTSETTPQLIAQKAGFTVYPEDTLTLSTPENFIQDAILGQKLTIDRATPVSISLYGTTPAVYRSHAKTVGDLLAEKGIVPEAGATVTPSKDTALTANTAIFVSKYGKTVTTAEEEVPFEIQSTNDATLNVGTVNITKAGVKGKKQVVYEIVLRDGKEVSRTKIQEVITEQPQTQTQIKGTKPVAVVTGDRVAWMQAAGIAESDYMYVDYIVGHEGGWNGTTKWNKAGSGAYGLCQALPATKMASAGADYMTNPVTQLKWCSGYATGRYGSWYGAYNAWLRQGWW